MQKLNIEKNPNKILIVHFIRTLLINESKDTPVDDSTVWETKCQFDD